MTAIPYYRPLLIEFINPNNVAKKIVVVTAAALLLAISSQFTIPLQPVPVSLQSLVVLLIGGALGRKLAMLSVLQYINLGVWGLPVFAGGTNAAMALASPTAGYIYSFIISAFLAGWVAEKGLERRFTTGIIGLALAHQMIFVIGVSYLKIYLHVSWDQAFKVGYLPFLGFDIVKFVLAALFFVGVWKVKEKKLDKANTRTNFIPAKPEGE